MMLLSFMRGLLNHFDNIEGLYKVMRCSAVCGMSTPAQHFIECSFHISIGQWVVSSLNWITNHISIRHLWFKNLLLGCKKLDQIIKQSQQNITIKPLLFHYRSGSIRTLYKTSKKKNNPSRTRNYFHRGRSNSFPRLYKNRFTTHEPQFMRRIRI